MAMEKECIRYYIQRLYDRNLTTMSGGNLSIKGEDAIYVTPSEIDKGNLKADDIMEVHHDGSVSGKHRVTSEFFVHEAVYKTNPDKHAVLHSHTSSILGFSTARVLPKVNMLYDTGVKLSGKLGIAAYADPGTKALADETIKVLDGTNSTAILENHGLFIVEDTMEDCYDTLEDLDLICKIESNIKKIRGTAIELADTKLHTLHKAMLSKGTGVCEPYEKERALLVELLQRMYKRGISTSKNACFSWRMENGDVLINPDQKDVTVLTPKDLVCIHEGSYIGELPPHRDYALHKVIYENNSTIHNVITSRPPYVMAYACSDQEYVTRVIAECYGYLRNIEKKPFADIQTMGDSLKNYFDDYHNTVLLQNYACVVTGPYPLKAYDRMEVAESTAEAIMETYPVAQPVLMDQRAVEVIQKNCGIYPEPKND